MENRTEAARQILHVFLDRWPVERVARMNLKEYVSVGERDTFFQWLETSTQPIGLQKRTIRKSAAAAPKRCGIYLAEIL